MPLSKKNGANILAGSGKATTIERWRRVHAENATVFSSKQEPALSSSSASSPNKTTNRDPFAASSWQLGQLPDWKGKRFDLPNGTELRDAGVFCRVSSAPTLEFRPGDHTQGIKGPTPHFAADSFKLGNIPGWTGNKFELAHRAELEDAGAIRGLLKPAGTLGPGDHTLGIRGRPHFFSDYHNLGQVQGWKSAEFGVPAKHTFHSAPAFPDTESWVQPKRSSSCGGRRASEAPAGAAAEEEVFAPGDHTRGIRSLKPHFATTYNDHGQIPGWQGKRHDFGAVLYTRLRLTEWK